MSNRFIKQLIFGVFYLILFSAIGYGLYFLAWRPASSCFDNRQNQGEEEIDCGGPCQPCALKNLKPIDIFSQPQLLEIDGQTGALHFQLKNSNDAGADRFSYSVDFYDAGGEKIQSLSNDSFIYARQVKTIVEAPIKIPVKAVARIQATVSGINWRLAEEFSRPNIQTRSVKVETVKDQVKITGLVLNNNDFKLSSVQVAVITTNNLGLNVSVSKTILKDLAPFEERAFTVFAPRAGQIIAPDLTTVFVDGLR